MRDELAGMEMGLHLWPINSIGYGGVHHSFIEALDWVPEGEAGRTAVLERLEAFPTQVEQYTALLRRGMEVGRVASRSMLRKVPEQVAQMLADLDDPTATVRKLCDAMPPALAARAAAAVGAFRQGLERLAAFVSDVYFPKARVGDGCSSLDDGAAVYAACLEFHTTTTMTAAEVHQVGLEQVARIEKRYRDDVMAPLGKAGGTFEEFVAWASDPASGHICSSADELISGYNALIDRIGERLPEYFETQPKAKLEVVPKDSATAPAAYYMQGTSDLERPGRFYVNIANLNELPTYDMTALALHEGIPGHHLQGSLAIEDPTIPPFLRFVEDRRYEFCPARRQLYAAYLEGWGGAAVAPRRLGVCGL